MSLFRLKGEKGFTIPEVIVAGTIMIVLSVGTLTTFSYAVKINRGNNLRMQALSVLQLEVEFYRSLKFVPVGSDTRLNGGTYTNVRTQIAADNQVFNITVTIDNDVATAGIQTTNEDTTKFKEITVTATPVVTQNEGWLQNLGTNVTIQRVRSN